MIGLFSYGGAEPSKPNFRYQKYKGIGVAPVDSTTVRFEPPVQSGTGSGKAEPEPEQV